MSGHRTDDDDDDGNKILWGKIIKCPRQDKNIPNYNLFLTTVMIVN